MAPAVPKRHALLVLRGEIQHKNLWLVDLDTRQERALTNFAGDFQVSDSGFTDLPLVGQVKAAGMTISQFSAGITKELADGYLVNPKVSVEVTNYRPFYIMGEVNKPGGYPFVSGMSVTASANAGGRLGEKKPTIRLHWRKR